MKLLLSDKANRFPPIACRLLARHQLGVRRVQAMTDAEIAERAGLALAEVMFIEWSRTWDRIEFAQMTAFLRGCNIDFDNRNSMRTNTFMMKSGSFLYLRKSPLWHTQFREMIKYWKSDHA